MPTIHELLDDTQKKCEALVDEMNAFKQARSYNQKIIDSLDSVHRTLQKTTQAIRPFTEMRVRRFKLLIGSLMFLNTLMFMTILSWIFFKKPRVIKIGLKTGTLFYLSLWAPYYVKITRRWLRKCRPASVCL